MGRVHLAVGLLVAWLVAIVATGRAEAGGATRKVVIETNPPGATVYIGLKESGAVGTTPVTLDLPVGDTTTVIIELAGYAPIVEGIDVPKSRGNPKKPMRTRYDLVKAEGKLIVEGAGAAKGATVKVDGEERGRAPLTLDVGEGAHQVEVIAGSRVLYSDYVEVENAGEVTVTPTGGAAGGGAGGDDGGAAVDPLPARPTPEGDGEVTEPAPARTGGPRIEATATADVGFRTFAYTNGKTGNLRPLLGGSQFIAGLAVQAWPFELLDVAALRRLSVEGSVAFGVPAPIEGTSLKTFWRLFAVGARYRLPISDAIGVDFLVGYTRDQLEFSGDAGDIAMAPQASYQSVRFGLHVTGSLGLVELYGGGETRIVLSGGELGTRFSGASATGYAGRVGARLKRGRLVARVEASLLDYAWTFTPQTADAYRADGGDDQLISLTAGVGVSY